MPEEPLAREASSEDAAGLSVELVHDKPVSRRKSLHVPPSTAVMVALTLAAAAWGGWWLFDRLTNVYVLDARVAADMVLISSRVPGWVVEVPVSESDRVTKGDVLLRIDARTAAMRLGELEAALEVLDAEVSTVEARVRLVDARTQSHLESTRAQLDAARSELEGARSELEVAEADWKRAGPLRERNLLSQQEFEAERNTYRTAEQDVHRAEAQVATAKADVSEAQSERAELAVLNTELVRLRLTHKQREIERDRSQTELGDHVVRAPVLGVVDERFIDAGEYVAPGQRVMIMHDPARIWLKANVKETDIRYLEEGKIAQVHVDAFPDTAFEARVSRIGGAATSQFALLPNPNPSGNFTKITQRVEVALELSQHDPLLKPGMMVEIKIAKDG